MKEELLNLVIGIRNPQKSLIKTSTLPYPSLFIFRKSFVFDKSCHCISVAVTHCFFVQLTVGVYSEEKVKRTLDAMKGRRDNLLEVKL